MGRAIFVITLVIATRLAFTPHATAQTSMPTIHNVTVQESAGVLTITGTGFGQAPTVMIAGQPVAVLSGGTGTQIDVVAPAALLTTPGSYRLTLVDPLRQVGDAFVVASHSGAVVLDGLPSAMNAPLVAPVSGAVGSAVTGAIAWSMNGPGRQIIEDSGSPYRTAVGYQALLNNGSGQFVTAIGFRTLHSNTSGSENTAIGHVALRSNTTGSDNTATGADALFSNTTGNDNTAIGSLALGFNNTGSYNTAIGSHALSSNTAAVNNTAVGAFALNASNWGGNNTAIGFQALLRNTSGESNTAAGAFALQSNTTGLGLTATGVNALLSNTTGNSNSAFGTSALQSNTTGFSNAASGYAALYSNTTGHSNAALGTLAGYNATAGSYNLFLGAEVRGTAADTNTIRIGLPYDGTVGQNKTFIAGIRNTQLSGSAVQVFIDANGQLGTVTAGVQSGTINVPIGQLEQQVREQQSVIADLRARLERLEALLAQSADN